MIYSDATECNIILLIISNFSFIQLNFLILLIFLLNFQPKMLNHHSQLLISYNTLPDSLTMHIPVFMNLLGLNPLFGSVNYYSMH